MQKHPGLEVRLFGTRQGKVTKEYSLVLSNPSELEFLWFENTDRGMFATTDDISDRLWDEHNPQLKSTIDKFLGLDDGFTLDDIADVIGISAQATGNLRDNTAKEYELEVPESKRKGRGQGIRREFLSYMLAYDMPVLEGWKTSKDIAQDLNVFPQTINKMCRDEKIEARKVMNEWYLSKAEEQHVKRRINPARLKDYVRIIDGRDYYSLTYAARKAAIVNGVEETSKEFKAEVQKQRDRIDNCIDNSLSVKSNEVEGDHYLDRKNLELVCDLITGNEAAELAAVSAPTIIKWMGLRKLRRDKGNNQNEDALLPAILIGRTHYTRRSHVLEYLRERELQKVSSAPARVKIKTVTRKVVTSSAYRQRYETAQRRISGLQSRIGTMEAQHLELSRLLEEQGGHEPGSSEPDYKLLKKVASLRTVIDQMQRDYEKREEDLGDRIGEWKARYNEQERMLIELERKLVAYQKRDSAKYIELAKTATLVAQAVKELKPLKGGEEIGRYLSYLEEAAAFTPSKVEEDSLYRPAVQAAMSFPIEISKVPEHIMQYMQTNNEGHAQFVKSFVQALAMNLAERS